MNKMSDNSNKFIHSGDAERLYLLQEDSNEVYVDNLLLEQHQIDGLRFLFKLFNKKSPGAVVNYPQSCGKAATVALFLDAVTKLLKSPALILCKDANEMQYWKEILLKWSSYVDEEISVESLNPFIRGKKVFLKTCESMTSYLRRNWSIVVTKENMDIFKLKFEADFKIFLTSTDIKKDLSLLAKIYTWLYPKSKVNILDFVGKENRPKERFRKSIQLDFLLDDFAIRRFINLEPFQTSKKADIVSEIVTEVKINDQKRRLKNKDATGTKIKRSRRVTTDDIGLNTKIDQNIILVTDPIVKETSDQNFFLINDDIVNNQNVIFTKDNDDDDDYEDNDLKNNDCVRNIVRDIYIERNSCMNTHNSSINESNSFELDVENFITNHKPIKLFPNEDTEVNPNRVNYSGNKNVLQTQLIESLNLGDSKLDSKEIYDLNDIPVKEESNKSKYVKNIKLEDLDKSPTKEESTESLTFENHSTVDLTEIKSNSKVNLIAIEELDKSPIKEVMRETFEVNETRHSEINIITEESTESLSFGSDSNVNINEMKGLKNINMLQKQLIKSLDKDDEDVTVERKYQLFNAQNNHNERLQDVVNQCVHELDNEITAIKEEPDCDLNGKDENIDGNKNKSDDSGKDIDYKISLMEEKALKKFKGSLLDSIF